MLYIGDDIGWWMLWGTLMMVVFWGGIIAVVIWAVQSLTRGATGQSRSREADASSAPLDIVKQRYARGEIDREEFEQLRRDLA